MVKKESSVYLFVGQDSPSKDKIIAEIKEEYLLPNLQDFNFDRLYAKDLTLKDLQEKLLCLPVKVKKRIIIVHNAQKFSSDIKKFISDYVRKPQEHIILVLDMDKAEPKDEFVNSITRYTTNYIKEEVRLDTFSLFRQIELRKPGSSLKILRQLLDKGERPERILGGLRYAWESRSFDPLERRKKLRLLLLCDIDIKTGRLRADFVLEKLVINLCCLKNP
jgi:DNA polymerase III delta subunit